MNLNERFVCSNILFGIELYLCHRRGNAKVEYRYSFIFLSSYYIENKIGLFDVCLFFKVQVRSIPSNEILRINVKHPETRTNARI